MDELTLKSADAALVTTVAPMARPPTRGAGVMGASRMPMPQVPYAQEPMRRQEPVKLGMFEGSVTLLSASVDADEAPGASEALTRHRNTGVEMVSGSYVTANR